MIGFLLTPKQSVYIMLTPGQWDRFKVGISSMPNLRAGQVSKSNRKKAGTKPVFALPVFWAYPVEQFLHLLLKPFHAPEKQGDGRTEWFSVFGLGVACAVLVGGYGYLSKIMDSQTAIFAALAILFLSRFVCIVFISFLILAIRFLQELILPGAVLAWMYFS